MARRHTNLGASGTSEQYRVLSRQVRSDLKCNYLELYQKYRKVLNDMQSLFIESNQAIFEGLEQEKINKLEEIKTDYLDSIGFSDSLYHINCLFEVMYILLYFMFMIISGCHYCTAASSTSLRRLGVS